MDSQSPLDAYASDINRLLALGLPYTEVARLIQEQHGIQTTRHSVRRFVERQQQVQREMVEKTIKQQDAKAKIETALASDYKVITQHFGFPTTTSTETSGGTWGNSTYTLWGDKPLMREVGISVPKPTKSKVEWGFGGAKLTAPAGHGDAEVVVSVSDIHFPYQDQPLVDEAVSVIERLDPDRIILNGDINDFFQLSRFNTKLERLDHLQEEIDLANAFRRRLRQVAPNAVIDETEGNHDSRIRTFVQQHAKALHSLDAIQPNKLFLYDELEIDWHPGAGFLLRREFLVKHGTLLRQEAPNSGKAELLAAGISGVSGHTHRLGTYRRSGYVQRQWTEQGGLMRLDPDYVVGMPNWQQGLVVGEFSYTSGAFRIHEVPAVEGKLALFGEAL